MHISHIMQKHHIISCLLFRYYYIYCTPYLLYSVLQCHILLEYSVYGGMLMLIACKLSGSTNLNSLFSEDLFVLSK